MYHLFWAGFEKIYGFFVHIRSRSCNMECEIRLFMRVKIWRLVNGYHIWKESFARCPGQAVQEEKVLLGMVDPESERTTNMHTVTIYQWCVCVYGPCTVRRTVHTHTHTHTTGSKLTLPNTDQTHDKHLWTTTNNFSQVQLHTPWWWIAYDPKHVGVIFNFVSFNLLYNVDFNL